MYTYQNLQKELAALRADGAQSYSIGESIMGRSIDCIQLGRGDRRIFIGGAYHGLEYITSAFLMGFAADYLRAEKSGGELAGYPVDGLGAAATLYIVPMVNPDGVDIAVNGLDIMNPYHRRLISDVGIHSFCRVWQANAAGVDLNHNYDAGWQMFMETPCPSKYGGTQPEDQPETKAVTSFVRKIEPDLLLAFHTQGKEIYYDFEEIMGERGRQIAEFIAKETAYKVTEPTGSGLFGGCKDWFIREFHRPGFTVELGKGKNPLPPQALEEILRDGTGMICRAVMAAGMSGVARQK